VWSAAERVASSMARGEPSRRALAILLGVVVASTVVTPDVLATETDEPQPYRTRTFALVDLPMDRLSFTGERPPALPQQPPIDRRGVPLFRWRDGRLYYRPGGLAINGMKRLDAYRDTGDRRQLEQALVLARHLRGSRLERDDAWWLPFWFDYAPEGLQAPWFNAMSQGLVLSFFVRLHRVTGDDVHLRAAEGVFESFRRLGPRQAAGRSRRGATGKAVSARPWVAYIDDRDNLWLEHYPRHGPDHVLNAHLHALIGLYEFWQHTRSEEARRLLEGALTTVRERAGQYRRRGRVSVYGMRSRTNHFKYHEVHIWQLRLLGRMTDDPFFSQLGATLSADRPPEGHVPGRPAVREPGIVLDRARRGLQVAHYPPVRPALERAG
jgi:hypothetical protein